MVAAASATGATGAALARLTDSEQKLELVAVTGISETAVERWRLQWVGDESPLAEAVRSLQPTFARGGLLPGELDTGSAVALPLTVEGHPVGVLGLDYAAARTFDDVERERFESLAASAAGAFDRVFRNETGTRARYLHELASQLAVLRTRDELAESIVLAGAAALGASAASLAMLDVERQELRVLAAHGYSEETRALFDPLPLAFEAPLTDAVRTGELIMLEAPEELDASYPDVPGRRGAPTERAVVAIPLAVGGVPFGALSFSFAGRRLFDDDTCAFMLALSRLCAQALDRVEAARLHDRTARLQVVAAELVRTVTQADVAQVIVHEGLAALGAIGGRIAVVDPVTDTLATIAVAGYPDGLLEELRDAGEESLMPVAAVCISGEPLLISSLDEVRSEWPVAAREFGKLGHRAAAAVPLRSHHGIIGAIAFTWAEEQPFRDEDVSFLGALAGLCTESLERSRLYEASERSRTRLRHVLDRLGEAVIEVDSELTVTYANEEGCHLFGDRALVGKILPDLWPEVGLRDLARFQLDETAEPIDERTPLADGRTLEVTAMHEDGEAIIVLRDVSRRERQER
ncbi:MAG TPA: GAF domain-containing protein, partial [Gaiellaceae bacterium]|nr:GAF domain-containing protein [Gaiellaceae bacterium]